MNRTTERPSGGERDPIAVEARLLEANCRVSDAERAAAALRRRAEAAEVRVTGRAGASPRSGPDAGRRSPS